MSFALILCCPSLARADALVGTTERIQDPAEKHAASAQDASFVGIPIPISDPAVGTGLGIAAMMLYNADGGRPWTTGAGALYTDTDTWGAVLFHKAYFDNDRFRLTAAAGYGVFNVDFFGIGADAGARGFSVALQQEAAGGLAEFLMRVRPHLYFGARYRGATVNTTVKTPMLADSPIQIPELQFESATSAIGPALEFDTRGREYGPTHGLLIEGEWLLADETLGSDFSYDRATLAANGYHELRQGSVLAWRGALCSVNGAAPFYDLCNYGAHNDLRGYATGQYRDRTQYAVQAELRQHLFWRVGMVAFAGVGAVADSFSDFARTDMLPAAGLGLRFEASRTYHTNVSIDVAVGDHSGGVYFYIGDSF